MKKNRILLSAVLCLSLMMFAGCGSNQRFPECRHRFSIAVPCKNLNSAHSRNSFPDLSFRKHLMPQIYCMMSIF